MDDEIKRIVDEQYQRGMKMLRDNMYLLDELLGSPVVPFTLSFWVLASFIK